LKLICDEPLSNFGPNFNLRRYTEARECLHWIEINNTALRKILKKWDKTNHSTKVGRCRLTPG
jgi:hypothetical protein